ncbi:protein phosphatase 2C domain-containing protein [Deltaproteobacteria bacterium OttesenSCG-928-K17]|nr:protein phosphatase 2C domain-containing protein [Deltaproteobacteria bacterium OttesenSCG-928-K17]
MEQARQSGTPFYFVAQESHVGYDRLVNEDCVGSYSTQGGELFIVANGLSGPAGGGVASRLAVSAFRKSLAEETGAEPSEMLLKAVAKADAAVIEAGDNYPELKGLGVSLVAVLLRNNEAWFVHVGDSRLYLASAGGLRRLTREAGAAAQDGDGGGDDGDGEKAQSQFLGGAVDVNSLVVGRHYYKADDSFLLSTSGLTSLIDDQAIGEILSQKISPQDKARKLIETSALAGGADNISVQVVAFEPGPDESGGASFWSGGGFRKFMAGFGCGLILGLILMYILR